MTQRISLIWAMTNNRVIGRDNDLPWRLPDEMRHFMRTTVGKPVIMGRKQWQAMARPLPERTNIVISRDRGFVAEGALVADSFEAALALAREDCTARGVDEIMVIGGAEIYALALPRADRLYVTHIDVELDGDTFFPEFDESGWTQVAREDHPVDERHPYAYSTRLLERRQNGGCGS